LGSCLDLWDDLQALASAEVHHAVVVLGVEGLDRNSGLDNLVTALAADTA